MKIERIELEAFRIYEKRQIFNFKLKNNKVANLIILYGPNGYGKTSFFDAIEWSLTGRIKRFDETVIKKERNFKQKRGIKEKQFILKNIDSNQTQGIISIKFDNIKEPKVFSTPLAKRRTSTDYKPNTDSQFKLSPEKILTQEGIDTFLRVDTPEDRFNRFIADVLDEIWGDYIQSYKYFNKLLSKIGGEINEQESNLNEINESLDEFKIPSKVIKILENNFKKIKDITNSLSDKHSTSLIFPPLDKKFIKGEFDSIQINWNSILNFLTSPENGLIYQEKEKLELLYNIKEKFQNNIKNSNQIQKLNEEIKSLEDVLIKFKLLRTTEIQVSNYKEKYAEEQVFPDSPQKLIIDRLGNILDNKKKLNGLVIIKNNNQNSHEVLIDKLIRLVKDYLAYLKKKREQSNSNLYDFDDIPNKWRTGSLMKEFNALQAKKQKVLYNIEEIKEKNNELEKDERKLREFVNFSLKYIRNKKINHCPLCGEAYENSKSTEQQIRRIQSKQSENRELRIVEKRQDKIDRDIKLIRNKITDSLDKNIKKLGKFQEYFIILKGKITNKSINLEREFQLNKTDYKNYIDKIFEKVIFDPSFSAEISKYMKEIEKRLKENSSIDKTIEHLNLEIKKIQFILEINARDIIHDIDLKNLKISDIEKVKQRLDLYKASQIKSKTEVENLEKTASKLKKDLKNYREFKIDNELKEKRTYIRELELEVREFKRFYASTLNMIYMDIGELEEILNKSRETIENLEILSKILKENIHYLENLKMYSEYNEKSLELLVITNRIENLQDLKDYLKEPVKIIQNYIIESITNYFDKKLINFLYQKLDPHPIYKDIEFDITLKKKPALHIYVEKGKNVRSPVIYLSSAQVNVISLCIFLARAMKTTEKNEIETIFLDDPIQNMDSINILSFIDLLRNLINEKVNKQLIISTHDENLFKLLQMKLSSDYFPTKFFRLKSFGVLSLEN